MGQQKFRKLYRMWLDTLRTIKQGVTSCSQNIQGRISRLLWRRPVDSKFVLAVTLKLLAGVSYLEVFWLYGISFSTVKSCFSRCIRITNENIEKHHFSFSELVFRKESTKWKRMRNSPVCGIIAAIYGDVILIKIPDASEVGSSRKYFNRKWFIVYMWQSERITKCH